LDRLLWLFLRLLLSKAALDRFLQTMNQQELSTRLSELRKSFAAAQAAQAADKTGGDDRVVKSLQDSIAMGELRLDNYARAKKNAEFVTIELDRLDGKIQALATTAAFELHGNTDDLFRIDGDANPRYGVLTEFLAEQLFGRWSLVLHYDLGQGLRAFAGRDEKRLKDMVALANKKVGDLSALSKDPAAALALLDRFVRNNIMAAAADRLSVA